MLVVMIGIRKSLDCIFTHRELKILDDVMPEMSKRAAVEDLSHLEEKEVSLECPIRRLTCEIIIFTLNAGSSAGVSW